MTTGVLTLWGCDSRAKQELALARAELVQTQAALEACQAAAAEEEQGTPAEGGPVDAPGSAEEQPAAPPTTAEPPPLVAVRTRVRANSAGTPELRVWVRNDSDKSVDAFRFQVACFDNFGDRVTSRVRDAPAYRAQYQAETARDHVRPGSERRLPGEWPMFRFEGCTKGQAIINTVHFTDGSTWSGLSDQENFPDSAI